MYNAAERDKIPPGMRALILGVVVLLAAAQPMRSENRLDFGGYLKNFSILFDLPSYASEGRSVEEKDMGAVSTRLRLHLKWHLSAKLSLRVDYDLSPRIQDSRLFTEDAFLTGWEPLEYRVDDFRDLLYPRDEERVSSFGVFHNLDRCFLTLNTGFADIFLGRQAIAWGSGRVINPTDVIAPFAFNELDKEERRGVDAVRIRIPLGPMDELDVGFVAGRDLRSRESAFFVRGKTYALQTDISALLVGFRNHLLLGLDIARAIGQAGFWWESALVIPEALGEGGSSEKAYFRSSAGMDYNPTGKTYGFIEYHFNSAGKNKPASYMHLFSGSAYREGSVYLLGKHYLNVGITYQMTPLMPATCLLLFNLSDRSLILSPFLEYNIAENIYLSAGAYVGIGGKPLSLPGASLMEMKSEFGTYPDMFFTSFRVYF